MNSKILMYVLALSVALTHLLLANSILTEERQAFQSGEALDLSGHGGAVIIVDFPVAVPTLLGLQWAGYGYGDDDLAKARVLDRFLLTTGTIYWFFGVIWLYRVLRMRTS